VPLPCCLGHLGGLLGWVWHDDGIGGHALLVLWWCEEGIDGIWVGVLVCHGAEGFLGFSNLDTCVLTQE